VDFFTRLEPQPLLVSPSNTAFYQQMQGLVSQMRNEGCLNVLENEKSSSKRAAPSKTKIKSYTIRQK
jgi:hypothetical protein